MVDGDQYLAYHPSGHAPQQMWSASPTATSPPGPFAAATAPTYPQSAELSYTAGRAQGTPGYSAVRDGYAPPAPPTPTMLQELGTQVDSSAGPSRSIRGVTTRRQARAQAAQQQPRSVSAPQPSVQQVLAADGATYYPAGSMSPPAMSRPQTPNGSVARDSPFRHPYPPPSEGHVSPNGVPTPAGHSPAYPSTPLSSSTTYSPYSYFPNHSRSVSGATSGPRSASPASSIRSAITSLSSASAPPYGDRMSPALPRFGDKQKKTRLTNADRRKICVYSGDHPTARQEDIAAMWNVERSTISKILKAKAKWLATPIEDDAKTARHRPSKFPEIEREMEAWLHEVHKNGRSRPLVTLSDHNIRTKAKEIARNLQISEEKFKASSGWVENFKHRHNIKRGVWNGPALDETLEEPDGALAASFEIHGTDAVMHHADDHVQVDANGPVDYTRNIYPPPLPSDWDLPSHDAVASTSSSVQPSVHSAPPYPPPPSSPPLPFPLVARVNPAPSLQSLSAVQETPPPGPVSALPGLLMNGTGLDHSLSQRHPSDGADFGAPPLPDELPSPPAPPNGYGSEPLAYPRPRPAIGLPASIIAAMREDSPMASPTSGPAYGPPPYHYASTLPLPPPAQLPPVPLQTHVPDFSDGMPTQSGAVPSPNAHEHGSHFDPSLVSGQPSAQSDVKGAEEHMDALLDFFDGQPEGAIITPEDREKLAQIRCKLLATANGVSYRREDRARRPS